MLIRYVEGERTSRGIVRAVERAVEDGGLPPDEEIPSVRGLAAALQVSPGTVSAAFKELRLRGYITTYSGKPSRISPRPPLSFRPKVPMSSAVRDLSSGNADPTLLPDLGEVWPKIDLTPHLYGGEPGNAHLLQAAAEQFDLDGVSSGDVTVTHGAVDGMARVLALYCRLGDKLAVEDPCFPGLLDLARVMGLEPYPVHVDESGMVPESLQKALSAGARACVITPRAQNPTSAAVDSLRASHLRATLAEAPSVVVVENDYAGPVAGSPHHTVTQGRERWAVVRSVSKSLGPDLRLATLAGDRSTVSRVAGHLELDSGWVSHLLQRLVLELWQQPGLEESLSLARESYTQRRTELVSELRRHDIYAIGRSGLNVYIPVARELPVVRRLLHLGWSVREGEPYRLRSAPFIRITVSLLKIDEIEALAHDIVRTLQYETT